MQSTAKNAGIVCKTVPPINNSIISEERTIDLVNSLNEISGSYYLTKAIDRFGGNSNRADADEFVHYIFIEDEESFTKADNFITELYTSIGRKYLNPGHLFSKFDVGFISENKIPNFSIMEFNLFPKFRWLKDLNVSPQGECIYFTSSLEDKEFIQQNITDIKEAFKRTKNFKIVNTFDAIVLDDTFSKVNNSLFLKGQKMEIKNIENVDLIRY